MTQKRQKIEIQVLTKTFTKRAYTNKHFQEHLQITHQNIQGLTSNNFYTLSPLLSSIQKGEYTPNTELIQKQLFSNRCFLKLYKIYMKTHLLESFFNNVAGLKAWNIKKRLTTSIFLWILHNLSWNFIYRTPPNDCSCLFLSFNWSFIQWSHFVHFFLHFFLLLSIIAIMGVCSESV